MSILFHLWLLVFTYPNELQCINILSYFRYPKSSLSDIFNCCFPTQYDLQQDFAWVTDEAYCLVVLALLQVAFLESVMTKDLVHGAGHSPVCQILLQIVVRAVITSSPPAWTSSAGCCRLHLTSLSSMIVLQLPLLCEGWGGRPLCLSGDSSVLMDLH